MPVQGGGREVTFGCQLWSEANAWWGLGMHEGCNGKGTTKRVARGRASHADAIFVAASHGTALNARLGAPAGLE